ncbi:MAG: hypothetical protein Harvfovirus19_26, partial [Harvfovirus sp.]
EKLMLVSLDKYYSMLKLIDPLKSNLLPFQMITLEPCSLEQNGHDYVEPMGPDELNTFILWMGFYDNLFATCDHYVGSIGYSGKAKDDEYIEETSRYEIDGSEHDSEDDDSEDDDDDDGIIKVSEESTIEDLELAVRDYKNLLEDLSVEETDRKNFEIKLGVVEKILFEKAVMEKKIRELYDETADKLIGNNKEIRDKLFGHSIRKILEITTLKHIFPTDARWAKLLKNKDSGVYREIREFVWRHHGLKKFACMENQAESKDDYQKMNLYIGNLIAGAEYHNYTKRIKKVRKSEEVLDKEEQSRRDIVWKRLKELNIHSLIEDIEGVEYISKLDRDYLTEFVHKETYGSGYNVIYKFGFKKD